MTFREQLKKIEELGISLCDLRIAFECDCVFSFYYTEEEFEELCKKATECYLASENVTEYALAYTINNLIKQEKRTIKQVIEMDKWLLLNKASYYV